MRQPLVLFVLILSLALSGCGSEQLVETALLPSATRTPTLPPAQPSGPQGGTILVTNTDDSGDGSLRQALLDAEPYDTITFDPRVFKPNSLATVALSRPLPTITQGHLAIDASDAGVVLDGGGLSGSEGWIPGLRVESDGNAIRGLHIVNFSGAGIALYENAHRNTIGGDPGIGGGPLGQGNLISGNSDGIGLMGSGENTIAGNRLGVEMDGIVGNNRGAGVYIQDRAPGNFIGPDNIIANNGPGVDIRSIETGGTTISRNLIYGNETDIRILPRGTSAHVAPVVLAFDLAAGTLSGVTCPRCEVEVFSGEGGGAEHFEGVVTADPEGYFTFTAEAPFAGSSLVATSTMADGSTSMFSLPTEGVSHSEVLQAGNTLPVQVFYALSSEEITEDNRISAHRYFPQCWENDYILLEMGGLGVSRVRLSFNEMEVPYELSRSEVPSDTDHGACIDYLHGQGMEISYIISFWDKQAQLSGEEVPCERFTHVGAGDPETERYLEFVRSVVSHLMARGIHQYEIWNESDNFACTQGIDSQNYINLVALVAPEIKRIDPDARVIVGGVTGTHDTNSQNYLRAIVNSDLIMPLVDGVSWHPFYGPSPAYPDVARYYDTYPSFASELQAAAIDSGFTGEFFADELTWRTLMTYDPGQPWAYEEIVAAKYYARGILMHLGLDITAGVDVDSRFQVIYATVRNIATVMAGNMPATRDVVIESEAEDLMYYSFALANGDQLFAIWMNGAAVEYDPGVNTTLTLTFSDGVPENAVGIDVLQGYSQQLNTEVDGNLLILHDLRVKDYPLIIKFSDAPPG